MILDWLTMFLSWSVTPAQDFWSNPLVTGLITVVTWTGRALMFCAIIVMIVDAVEDVAAGKAVYASTIVGNIIKGMLFVELAPFVGKYAITLCDTLVTSIDIGAYTSNTTDLITAMQMSAPVLIISLIGCLVWLFQALKRFGSMLIQIVSCVLYVPSIVRGDTTAMGSWIRQTIAIALTFLLQYVLFYISLVFLLGGQWLLAIAMWISIGSVPRLLDKYGLSHGGGGMATAGHMAMQGISMLAR